MQTITVLPGSGKDGTCEAFTSIELQRGKLYTIVGSTGSGKSRFIKDIEQLAGGDSITHRHVLLDNAVVPPREAATDVQSIGGTSGAKYEICAGFYC